MKRCIVLEGGCLPNLYSGGAACHYPGPEDQNLPYGLVEITGELDVANLLSSLKYPESLRPSIA